MLQKAVETKSAKQLVLVGLTFLMAGLGALVLFSEPTPLLVLGILFVGLPLLMAS